MGRRAGHLISPQEAWRSLTPSVPSPTAHILAHEESIPGGLGAENIHTQDSKHHYIFFRCMNSL